MQSWGINRVVILQGESGDGKTTAARILAAKFGDRVLTIEASEAWGDKPAALLGSILRALGSSTLPPATADRLIRAQDASHPRASHDKPHCGPRNQQTKPSSHTTHDEIVLLATTPRQTRAQKLTIEAARLHLPIANASIPLDERPTEYTVLAWKASPPQPQGKAPRLCQPPTQLTFPARFAASSRGHPPPHASNIDTAAQNRLSP